MEHRIDPWLVLAAVTILGASLATLSAVGAVVGGSLLPRQMVWVAIGLASLWLLSRLHTSVSARIAPVVYALGLAALVAVLVAGEVRGGSRAWFVLGPFSLQPSELARLTTAMMLAAWMGRRKGGRLGGRELALSGAIVVVPALLVLAEPDLGVALTYSPLLVATWWLGGVPARAWIAFAIVVTALGVAGWQLVLRPYQKERVLTVLDPGRDPFGAGYQVRQSKIAVGSGELLGHGIGRGTQSLLRFLPAQHTDFVFAAWAEATGFAGATLLLAAYALLLARVGVVALAAGDRYGLSLASLVAAWLAFQVLINVGMVVGWLPTAGITLPLFSYGGSSLLTSCAALGLVQSVWRHRLVNR